MTMQSIMLHLRDKLTNFRDAKDTPIKEIIAGTFPNQNIEGYSQYLIRIKGNDPLEEITITCTVKLPQ